MLTSYKSLKQSFVSGTHGSSLSHTNAVSLVALATLWLYTALTTRFPSHTNRLLPQWLLLVLPLLLSMTLFASAPNSLSLLLAVPAAALHSRPRRDLVSPLPSRQPSDKQKPPRFPPLIALDVYRAHMMLMTILAILAVDFPVFPRALAKCESFGVSLMDLGVGSFVFSQGLVSAIPFISQPHYLTQPTLPKWLATLRKSLPILALGLIRVILVKGTDYPEHVTEYGVHWNFFLTLALIPLLQVTLHPILARYPISIIALVIALVHQATLTFLKLDQWVLSSDRTNIISANKEGIVSLLGYLSVHLFGLSTGTIVLPHTPSFFRRYQRSLGVYLENVNTREAMRVELELDMEVEKNYGYRQVDKSSAELFSYSFLFWSFLGVIRYFGFGRDVSRRLVNLQYVIWIAAFNTSFFLGYMILLDVLYYPKVSSTKKNKMKMKMKANTNMASSIILVDRTPLLLKAINKHGLVVFLLANLLTGSINLVFETMFMEDWKAMMILSGYSLVLCYVAWKLQLQQRSLL